MEYNFREVEKKWQQYWKDNKTFKTNNPPSPSGEGRSEVKPKYYVLDMFPYPSGAGLHVGHPLGYIASDIYARFKRLKGFNVLHPMGYDSFGLPAEQYAIQTGQHPEITTKTNIARYREQLDKIGFSFDWDREVRTSDPKYYKWTQWIFIQLFNSWYNKKNNKAEKIETLISEFEKNGNSSLSLFQGEGWGEVFTADQWKSFSEKQKSDVLLAYRLAYLSDTMVNWCPQLGTVLANEEVKDGVSERGGYPVERKLMKQWSLRITAYADRLLNDLETIDWTESIKEAQRNWIGKSEGTSLEFRIQNSEDRIEVFTTRPDTIFGVSFVTLAPEHELVEKITTAEYKKAVDEYITFAKNRSERERMADVKKITGVFTGAYVIHPFTGKQIPIWIGDYVLAGYGTGAVMAVPGHDSRDYAFAKHFDLPIIEVVAPPQPSPKGREAIQEAWEEKTGTLFNSDFLNGLEVKEAIKKAIAKIEEKNLGKGKTNFRLRDAIFGRQRYWGEPIPVYYVPTEASAKAGDITFIPKVLDEKELPLVLPEVDKYLPTETGEPPLARASSLWKKDGKYEYEHSTMPGWAGSSWYYLRYMDAHNDKTFASKEAIDYWQNVDLYMGGSEHATGHLLYVRFWTKFLYDLGLVPFVEPAKKLINQGMIQGTSEKIYKVVSIVQTEETDSSVQMNQIPVFDKQNKTFHFIPSEGTYHVFISSDIAKYFTGKLILLNVNIALVENGVLDTKEYASAKFKSETNKRFIFVTSEGYKTVEYEFNNIQCGDEVVFKTQSEVEKMSKRWENVVNPDDIVEKYGADCLRLYEMFLGPLELSKPWNTNGITGVSNFIRKLWRLYHNGDVWNVSNEPATKSELKVLHKTIKKIEGDIENFSFNTSVSNFMICVNELTELKCNKREILEPLAIIIAPYAPHVAEELWEKLRHTESITYAVFPKFKEEYLVESAFNYPISFNGKTRFFQEYDLSLSKDDIEKEVLGLEQTQKYLEGKTPKKIIVVHNKIVNIVI